MGTPDFAVPALEAVAKGPYDVVAVVTQPDRPQGRRRVLTPSPVKRAAQALSLPLLQPDKVRRDGALTQIAALRPDVLVTAAYGQILPQRLLDIPRLGCINIHASLLPRWRGAAPIHRALLAGDAETGVTLMEMVAALDAGPILSARAVPIELEDNVGSLHDRLAALGAQMLVELLPEYVSGRVKAQPQPDIGVTYAKQLHRDDEWINWANRVAVVHDHIRGLSPWPGAAAKLRGADFKIWAARPIVDSSLGTPELPGTLRLNGRQVLVSCLDGWIELNSLQPAGRKAMTADDWARGVDADGLRFSSLEPTTDKGGAQS
ncbi:methionyl-tRNA formyltransferase [Alicyclobacillus sp. ALC3]|nr:methionyl-tRNA formyltransferase [Alicyclobacillus sp. ALC3]